jgi:hypothetical protein
MATPETISTTIPETTSAALELIEGVELPGGKRLTAANFVIDTLRLTVKSGNLTPEEAAEKFSEWYPDIPTHPGVFK